MDAATLLTLTNSDVPYFDIDSVTDIEEDGDVLLFTATGPTMRALCQWSSDEGVIVIEWRAVSAAERQITAAFEDAIHAVKRDAEDAEIATIFAFDTARDLAGWHQTDNFIAWSKRAPMLDVLNLGLHLALDWHLNRR